MTLEEATAKLRAATQAIRTAEQDYGEAVEAAADAEAVYRAKLFDAFKEARAGGASVGDAELGARAGCITYSRERDVMAGRLKLAVEVLEDRRDDRRSLWRLMEWSARREAVGVPENAPNGAGYAEATPGTPSALWSP